MSQLQSSCKETTTAEERIAIRRSRIKSRLESKSQKDSPVHYPAHEESTIGDTEDGLDFNNVYFDGTELLTEIFVKLAYKEKERRHQEEIKRRKIQREIETLSNHAKHQLQESMKRWNEKKEKLPLDVYRLMEKERECLENILQLKEDQIADLKHLLKKTESDFQITLENFRSEYLEMVDVSHSLLDDFNKISGEEIHSLALELLDQSQKEESKNLEEIKEKCYKYIEHRLEQEKSLKETEKECQNNIRTEETEWKEECGDMRRNYQNEVQELTKEMRRITTFCLVNEEKLEYNIQVLKKRRNEWMEAKFKQVLHLEKVNRKFQRLQAQVKRREENNKTENIRLKNECEKLKSSITSLKKRIIDCTKVQRKKSLDIYALRLKEIQLLSNKILKADKIIHEQILIIPWDEPDMETLNDPPFNIASPKQESIDLKILNACCDQMGFISEDKLRESLTPLSQSDNLLIETKAIFEHLGILDTKDQNDLSRCFEKYFLPSDGAEVALTLNQTFEAFKEFLESRGQDPISLLRESCSAVGNIKHWEKYCKLLPKSREALWDAVQDTQKKYLCILKHRANLLKRKSEILQENKDLELVFKKVSSLGVLSKRN